MTITMIGTVTFKTLEITNLDDQHILAQTIGNGRIIENYSKIIHIIHLEDFPKIIDEIKNTCNYGKIDIVISGSKIINFKKLLHNHK